MVDGGLDLAELRCALAPHGVLIGARLITPGDELAFRDLETAETVADLQRRRASGAARIVARQLLAELGSDATATLRRSTSGAPIWPAGVVGSLAHDEQFAVAAVAWRVRLKGLGVDVEPAEALPADVVDIVLSPEEKRRTNGDDVVGRLIFASKEAVYKAIHPLDGSALEFDDIDIRIADGAAQSRDGRSLRLIARGGARLLAVALV